MDQNAFKQGKMRGLHQTNIEKEMKQALLSNNIAFVEQFPIRCKYGYILDFAIPELKIDIECDGEVWHKIGNHKDRKRNWVLRKKGWKVLRFRGNEILGNINKCINTIKINRDERR